ncbi:hypothetical protein Mal65_32540 [Crateriforma conspicua]|nr:hypothetical protein Mal65_32540 [Crateriforma conspicua]
MKKCFLLNAFFRPPLFLGNFVRDAAWEPGQAGGSQTLRITQGGIWERIRDTRPRPLAMTFCRVVDGDRKRVTNAEHRRDVRRRETFQTRPCDFHPKSSTAEGSRSRRHQAPAPRFSVTASAPQAATFNDAVELTCDNQKPRGSRSGSVLQDASRQAQTQRDESFNFTVAKPTGCAVRSIRTDRRWM